MPDVFVLLPLSDDAFGTQEERELLADVEAELAEAVDAAGAGAWVGHEWGGGELEVQFEGDTADALVAALAAADVDGVPEGARLVIYRTDDEEEEPEELDFRASPRGPRAERDPVDVLAELAGVSPEALGRLPADELLRRVLPTEVTSMARAHRATVALAGLVEAERAEATLFLGVIGSRPVAPMLEAIVRGDVEGFAAAASAPLGGELAQLEALLEAAHGTAYRDLVADFARRLAERLVALGA